MRLSTFSSAAQWKDHTLGQTNTTTASDNNNVYYDYDRVVLFALIVHGCGGVFGGHLYRLRVSVYHICQCMWMYSALAYQTERISLAR